MCPRTVAASGAEPVIADALDAAAVKAALVQVRPEAVINELTLLPRPYTAAEMAAAAEDAAEATAAPLDRAPGAYNLVDNDVSPQHRWLPAFANRRRPASPRRRRWPRSALSNRSRAHHGEAGWDAYFFLREPLYRLRGDYAVANWLVWPLCSSPGDADLMEASYRLSEGGWSPGWTGERLFRLRPALGAQPALSRPRRRA